MAKVKTFIGNVRGPQGNPGDKGDPGSGFKILGYYDSLAALQAAVPAPAAGDAYGIGAAAPYDIYIYSKAGEWVNNGPMQGAKGDPGVYIGSDTPPDTATVWLDQNGAPSGAEAWTFTLEDGTTVTKSVVVIS